MSTRTASQKVLQSFHARDTLWEIFTEQAREMDCSVDYLINEAMRAYAEAHAFLPAGASARSSQAPPPPAERFEERDSNYGRPLELARNRPSNTNASSLVMDDDDDLAALAGDEDSSDDLFGLDLDERDSGLPLPAESAPTIANPSGAVRPARPAVPSVPPPISTSSAPAVPSAPSIPRPPRSTTPPPPPISHPAAPSVPPAPRPMVPPGPPRASIGAPAASSIPPQHHPQPVVAPPMMQPGRPILTMIYQGRKIHIQKDQFIIGRGSRSADLPIKDPNVSRKHAAILFHNGAYYIKDLGSTNGVEYGNQLVDSKRIDEGDAFSICGHPFHFTYTP